MSSRSIIWTYDKRNDWKEVESTVAPIARARDLHIYLRENGFGEIWKSDDSGELELIVWRHQDESAPPFTVEVPRTRDRIFPADYCLDLWTPDAVIALVYLWGFPSLLDVMQQILPLMQLGMLRDIRDGITPVFVTPQPPTS